MEDKNKEEELLAENKESKEHIEYLKFCTLNYEKEYYLQQEKINQLMTENEKLKTALINIALRL